MRKRLVIGVAVIVAAIGAGFAIKAGKGPGAVPASAAQAANVPDKAASEVALDFTPAEAAKPLALALPQVVEFWSRPTPPWCAPRPPARCWPSTCRKASA